MLADHIEGAIRRQIPPQELVSITHNIGLPYSQLNLMYSDSGVIGASDADVLVSLDAKHHPTADYVRTLRTTLPHEFPATTFYFLPADMVTQILNFGLPAPVDVQIERQDQATNHELATRVLSELRYAPGRTDLRIQQPFDYPTFNIDVDRTKAAEGGYTDRDVTSSLLVALSGGFQTTPSFFLNWKNGVQYELISQTPQYRVQPLQGVGNIPLTSETMIRPEILSNVASLHRGNEMESISHYNIRRVIDIFGSVQDRDLASVGQDITRIVDKDRKLLPRGTFFRVRGQLETMRTSFEGLLEGLTAAIVLVYLLIVVNFQSWLDPFIIITALPAALGGISRGTRRFRISISLAAATC